MAPADFAVSPDNRWIAYSSDGTDIVLQPLEGGAVHPLLKGLSNAEVHSWLTAPLLRPGGMFKILPALSSLNVHASPGLDAPTMASLLTGDTFMVVGGPVQAEGYTWWHVQSQQRNVEGWVREFYGWFAPTS